MDLSEHLKLGLKDLFKSKQSNRAIQIRQLRQTNRDKCTMSQRNIEQSSVKMMEPPKINARMQAMLAWKAEKKLKEEQNKKKVKPIFKVSKVVATTKLEDIYPKKMNTSQKLVESSYKFKAPKNIKPINIDQTFAKYNNSRKADFNDSANRKATTKRTAIKNIKHKTNSNNYDKSNIIQDARKVSTALNIKPKLIKIKKEETPTKELSKKHNKNIKSPKDRNAMDVSESPQIMHRLNENVVKEHSMSRDAIIKVQTPKKLFRNRLYGTNSYIRKG